MDDLSKFTSILFVLPDGRLILQRRTNDAPYGPGLLGLFGGKVEIGETFDECLRREVVEETNLSPNELNIELIGDFTLPKSKDFNEMRHFYLFKSEVMDLNFEVYEGTGSEAYTVDELKHRTDLIISAQYVIDNIL
jgi:8-oxo-dGTP pyrophosphatase MutT (NUDIX family)